MELNIVKCGREHLDALTEFYSTVTDYLDRTINYPKWTSGIYPGRESILDDIVTGSQYMCLNGNKIVGAFVLNDDPKGDYSKGEWTKNIAIGDYLIIHTLAVAPDCYKQGIAAHMVRYCVDFARASGYKALRLDVVPDNFPARKLYEKAGFSFAGEKDLLRGFEEIPTFILYELNF